MKEKFYRFMQGRYGGDQLSRFLMILTVVHGAFTVWS